MLAMQGDTTRVSLAIETTVNDIRGHVQDRHHKDILKWLTKTDPSSNHAAACAKREAGTGEWFISSHEFSYWLLPGRSLWLHGIPGAGKTVLCSTIIENVKSRCPQDTACLFFYFDFSDKQKQTVINMLYSFVAQLSTSTISPEVRRLYEQCCNGTQEATVSQLTETLRSIADNGKRMYIIVDALDECTTQEALLNLLIKILAPLRTVNLLMTSRNEHNIYVALQGSIDYIISIQDERVDSDIRCPC